MDAPGTKVGQKHPISVTREKLVGEEDGKQERRASSNGSLFSDEAFPSVDRSRVQDECDESTIMNASNSGAKIRVGIVGLGNWARYGHIPALRLLPEYEIVAVSSRREETASAIAREFFIPHAFDDASKLVSHPDVDLVAVLPPAPQHAAIVRQAIAAGKDVYCEWPLTTNTEDSQELLLLAEKAQTRHVVGLQRRLGPSARYLRDLLAEGYVGRMRSVRLHVSMEYFGPTRGPALAWTLGDVNFSHVLSIYGGHFLDMLFHAVGRPKAMNAIVATQFPELTLTATGESFPNDTPDGVVAIGNLENDALFSIQLEGGKRNNAGLQIDITGTEGDLKVWNSKSFANKNDNILEGARGDKGSLEPLPVPRSYVKIPFSHLDVSVQDLAHLYAAHALDRFTGTQEAPNFADAVRMHKLIDRLNLASTTGALQKDR
jgi:predicted dehydrogenase